MSLKNLTNRLDRLESNAYGWRRLLPAGYTPEQLLAAFAKAVFLADGDIARLDEIIDDMTDGELKTISDADPWLQSLSDEQLEFLAGGGDPAMLPGYGGEVIE